MRYQSARSAMPTQNVALALRRVSRIVYVYRKVLSTPPSSKIPTSNLKGASSKRPLKQKLLELYAHAPKIRSVEV